MDKACKDCHRLIETGRAVCVCGSNAMSADWQGYVAIIDAEGSEIAKKMGIEKAGKYALKVR